MKNITTCFVVVLNRALSHGSLEVFCACEHISGCCVWLDADNLQTLSFAGFSVALDAFTCVSSNNQWIDLDQ